MPRREQRALGKPRAKDNIFRKWIVHFLWGICLDIKKSIVCPGKKKKTKQKKTKHCHLAQAEKITCASKPFDLLEIIIRMLRLMVRNFLKNEMN